MSSIKTERVAWLSPGRLAFGKITVLDGDPGLGKSTLTLDWAAKISRGEALPDGAANPPRGSLILSAEDDEGDTIRPRLEAAGADLRHVAVFHVQDQHGNLGLPSLSEHLGFIAEAIEATDAALVIIDPLMAFLSSDTNSNRDQDVRRTLAPLATVAAKTGAAIILVRHLNKTSGVSSLYRGGGSIGIIGAARFGLLVAKDPDDETGKRRVLAPLKCNIGPEPSALSWDLESIVGTDVARVHWYGISNHRADDLTNAPRTDEERGARAEARDWLQDLLTEQHQGVTVKEVKRLARDVGVSEGTLNRVRYDLGIKPEKKGFSGGSEWFWRLPAAKVINGFSRSLSPKTPHLKSLEKPLNDAENEGSDDRRFSTSQGMRTFTVDDAFAEDDS
jgi:hypothetical protein